MDIPHDQRAIDRGIPNRQIAIGIAPPIGGMSMVINGSRHKMGAVMNTTTAFARCLDDVGLRAADPVSSERSRSMSAVSKLALIPRTEVFGSKDREIAPFPASLLSRWDARSAGDHSAPLGSRDSERLTARERDVLTLISQGCSNKHIARALEVSPETVKSHVKHIFLKLEVGTRTEAVFRAVSLALL
jgi:DNA-binding NarL/FixJ family response regulator